MENISPWDHQENAVNYAVIAGGNYAFFHKPGTGKTRTCLELFKYYRRKDETFRMFVTCPLSLINAAWGEDIQRFTNFTYKPYKELKEGETLPDIVAINYEALIGKKFLPGIIRMITVHNFMCVLDESSRLKSHKSKTTETLLSIGHKFTRRIVCSGTPMPNSEMELWGQISFIKPGLLDESFFVFREKYFRLRRNGQEHSGPVSPWDVGKLLSRGFKFEIASESARKALMDIIAPYTDWVEKDVLDLPEKIYQNRDVILSAAEKKAYQEMLKDLIADIEGEIVVAATALTKYMKLRQVTSGFMYDAETKPVHIGNSKLNELKATLEELGTKQVIIWTQFNIEVEQIRAVFENTSRTYTYLTGQTKDKEKTIREFQEGDAQYLIVHPKSGAHGLRFVNCYTNIYYSLDYSYEHYNQAQDRTHRAGQTENCHYIHLLAPNTIDYDLLACLQKKQSIQDAVRALVRRSKDERKTTKRKSTQVSKAKIPMCLDL